MKGADGLNGTVSAKGAGPGEHTWQQLTVWLERLQALETHRAESYDLTVDLDPSAGRIEVKGVVRLGRPGRLSAPGGPDPAARRAPASGGPGEPGSPPDEVRFLLHPDFEVVEPAGVASGAGDDRALRAALLPAGAGELPLHYRGRLPRAWVSPGNTELALYCLWFPLFSGSLAPFTFRVVLTAPPDVIPVMCGRLAPLPPELAPRVHEDDAPRTYLWESTAPGNDIVVCAAPYLVHQRLCGSLWVEAYVLAEDYDIGDRYVDWAGRVMSVLTRWFGPLPAANPGGARPGGAPPPRLAVAVPERSNWGGYSRPGLIVAPRPLSTGVRDPEKAPRVAAFLAHEMGHLWYGSGVLSDTMNEPWLSEAFAEFARLVFIEAELGETSYRERLAAYARKAAAAAGPRSMRAVTTAHPEMDALARLRGGLMLACLRERLGDDLTARVLSGFAARYAGRIVSGEDFVAYASEAAAAAGHDIRSLRSFFAGYLDEPPGGATDAGGTG